MIVPQVRKTMLAIYCSAWDEGGSEKWKLDNQEERGTRYASAKHFKVYRDTIRERGAPRPEFERMMHDIRQEKIGAVWAKDNTRLFAFSGDRELFESLCGSRGVKVCFGNEFRLG
jgi:DNA invertase Pin-like site-specific DNA recombinase